MSASTIGDSDCDPLKLDADGRPYYPCGIVANSVFNDTFSSPIYLNPPADATYDVYYMQNNSDIAWGSDKALYGKTKYNAANVAVPPNWVKRYPDGYTNETIFNPVNDQQFQVWMRTAGLPTFSKLAQRNDTTAMGVGMYRVDLQSSKFSSACICHQTYMLISACLSILSSILTLFQTSQPQSMVAPSP